MERLTSYKSNCNREMICRYEDCFTDEEHCPHLNEDNCPCLKEMIDKLAEYEDLEEQGLLLKLPCKVGDTVHEIHPSTGKITERKIRKITICNAPNLTIMYESGFHYLIVNEDFGKTVFLAQAEAEEALKGMESEE